jgi:4-hydroxy-tetrahydrodipicolinate reductase
VKIAIHGAGGRMGQAVARLAADAGATVVGAIESRKAPTLGRDVGEVAGVGTLGVAVAAELGAGLLGAEVVIDFSTAAALPALAQLAMRQKVALVSGTTGLDGTCERVLEEAARSIPVLWAPNMSLGVHVLSLLAAQAVRQLGPGWDVEIVETHHRNKIDAPSGTARRLLAAVQGARQSLVPVYGREGMPGARHADEVGVLAVRGGDVIGDHTVHLLGPGERIELGHYATSRDLFARGALSAARFLVGKPPGRYSIADVVGGS